MYLYTASLIKQEWECFKVYDSMEFEDDETSTQEHSFRAEGTLDADATRALVRRDFQSCRSYSRLLDGIRISLHFVYGVESGAFGFPAFRIFHNFQQLGLLPEPLYYCCLYSIITNYFNIVLSYMGPGEDYFRRLGLDCLVLHW